MIRGCRPLCKRPKREVGSVGGSSEHQHVCERRGLEWPICFDADLDWSFWGLPHNTLVVNMSPHELTQRELELAVCKLKAEPFFQKYTASSVLVCAWDRSWSQWIEREDKVPTVDPHSKFYVLFREPIEERTLRPLSVSELFRFQGASLEEHMSRETVQCQLVPLIPYRSICKLVGNMFQLRVELAHFIAAVCGNTRLDASLHAEEHCKKHIINTNNNSNKQRRKQQKTIQQQQPAQPEQQQHQER